MVKESYCSGCKFSPCFSTTKCVDCGVGFKHFKSKHGGSRHGAGAKPKEKTEVLFRRVPTSIFQNVAEYVDKEVEAHKKMSFPK